MTRLWPVWYRPPVAVGVGEAAIRRACTAFGVTREQIRGSSRSRDLVYPRFAVMVALYRAGWSMPRIGALLGGRDNTTVWNGLRRAKEIGALDPDFAHLVEQVAA